MQEVGKNFVLQDSVLESSVLQRVPERAHYKIGSRVDDGVESDLKYPRRPIGYALGGALDLRSFLGRSDTLESGRLRLPIGNP